MEGDDCTSARLELEECRKSEERFRADALKAFEAIDEELKTLRTMYHTLNELLHPDVADDSSTDELERDSILNLTRELVIAFQGVQDAEEKVERLERDLEIQRTDFDSLYDRLKLAEAANRDLERRLETSVNEVDRSTHDPDIHRQIIDAMHEQLRRDEIVKSDLEGRLETSVQNVAKLERELDTLQASLDTCADEKGKVIDTMREFQSESISLIGRNRELSSKLDAKSEDLKRLEESLQRMKLEVEHYKQQARLREHAYTVATNRLTRLVNGVIAAVQPS